MDRIDVICFGGEDWWYKNRGHNDMQLMRRYAASGIVLYINSIVMQKPKIREGRRFVEKLARKAKSIFTGLKKSDAGFWVYSPFSLPLHHIRWARVFNERLLRFQILRVRRKLGMSDPLVWIACPAACDTAIKLKTGKLVYQRTDRYEEYPNVDAESIKRYDRTAKAHADLTIFANSTLFKEEMSQCRKAIFLDHGVDYEVFASAEKCPYLPEEIKGIPKPVVGFFGAIDSHTSDIALLEKVVGLLPKISFVLIGDTSVDCSKLKLHKNVWMLGRKPYEQIPHYGKYFDVAIMAWRQNRWIEACNPIKLKEYLSLGKPVVSTPFTELQNYLDAVYQASTPHEFAECIERALREDNSSLIAARRKKVEKASWESKAQLVLEALFSENEPARSIKAVACSG
ncbi:MAG TPA: glycosyltransferase [Sedimentisphaerales bacterium]|nr:glycosyltransferase [Sedimentisphaerales bacterium]